MNRFDLIIDALERANELWLTEPIGEQALAAARELRELKPVAWAAKSIYNNFEGLSFDKSSRFDTPLYALEKELAKPEPDHGFDRTASHMVGEYVDTAPPRKPWVALTHADLMKEFGYTDELLRNTAYGVEKIIKNKNT